MNRPEPTEADLHWANREIESAVATHRNQTLPFANKAVPVNDETGQHGFYVSNELFNELMEDRERLYRQRAEAVQALRNAETREARLLAIVRDDRQRDWQVPVAAAAGFAVATLIAFGVIWINQ